MGQAILQRLDGIEATLRRMCTEQDFIIAVLNGMVQDSSNAERLREAVGKLYRERADLAAERLLAQERDTEPPGAP